MDMIRHRRPLILAAVVLLNTPSGVGTKKDPLAVFHVSEKKNKETIKEITPLTKQKTQQQQQHNYFSTQLPMWKF